MDDELLIRVAKSVISGSRFNPVHSKYLLRIS